MELFLIVVCVLVICFGSAVAHEADIRRAIRKHGHTSSAGWLGKISGRLDT